MAAEATPIRSQRRSRSLLISLLLLCTFLFTWYLFTVRPSFDPKGLTEKQLMTMEFNGDIVRTEATIEPSSL